MLDMLFNPKSIAVVGASPKPKTVGNGLIRSLLKGGVFSSKTNKPFKGKIYAINPNVKKVFSLSCYASLLNVKGSIDLVIIAVPAKIVPLIMEDCVKKKVKGVIIVAAGFSELGEQGKKVEEEVLHLAKKGKIRVLGPNCLGIMRPSSNLNATFGPCMAPEGNVAFFSQSGALIDSLIDWSLDKQYGFSALVSLGNQADLEISDFLEWAAKDKQTRSIALYIEGVKNGQRFLKTASKVSKKKPIVALKAGRSTTGMTAVSSHTGSLAGSFEVYQAAFRKAGVHSADTWEDLFNAAETLAWSKRTKKGIVIITNGGGAGVLCADHCEALGIPLVPLNAATVKSLDASKKMHPAYSRRNPLDLVGDALHDRYEAALNAVLKQSDVGGVIVIQTLQTMTEGVANAKAILAAKKRFGKPIIAYIMGGKFSHPAVGLLLKAEVPVFDSPDQCARAMRFLVDDD